MQATATTDEKFQCTVEPSPIIVYFVYKGGKADIEEEIDLRELIKNIDYFYINRNNFSEGSKIELLNEEQLPFLDKDIITTFISYCTHKTIQITNDNVIQLQLLSKQFDIKPLLAKTDEYISKYHSELVLPKLLSNENEFNESIEQIIAQHLFQYINKDNFYRLSIPILYRILNYFNSNFTSLCVDENNDKFTEQITSFLFKCLDHHQSEASPLFNIFDFLFNDDKCLNRILNDEKYSKIFDFDTISAIKLVKLVNESFIESHKIQPEKVHQIKLNLEKQKEDDKTLIIQEGTTEIENSMYAGNECEKVIIPESVMIIGKNAFMHCKNLKQVIIKSKLQFIDDSAFYSCHNLMSINLPNSLKKIGESAFRSCSNLIIDEFPNSLTDIGNCGFYNCTSLTKVIIPNSLKIIKPNSFAYCSSLQFLLIPNSVTEIDSYAFNQCSSLTKVEIPKSMKLIKTHAFFGCSSLTKVEIPKSIIVYFENYSFPESPNFELKRI